MLRNGVGFIKFGCYKEEKKPEFDKCKKPSARLIFPLK